MRRIFTVVMLLITVTVVDAQDAQNPWHLIAFENAEEVAFYNAEMITGIEATAQSVTIALDNGKKFSHPLATTTFGFDPRKEGTATANESVIAPQWSVRYVNGRLYFSETVNSIAIYATNGVLMAQFAGSYTEVSVHLASGIYIVQANGKNAKLAIGTNGIGGMVVPPTVETKSTSTPAPISLQAGGAIKIYWNITANNSTMSVEMPNVEKFYFTVDNSIVFAFKNGNTVELTDYQGVDFSIEPAPITTTTVWDLERTIKFGGASYLYESNSEPVIIWSAIKKSGAVVFYLKGDVVEKTLNEGVWVWAYFYPITRFTIFIMGEPYFGLSYPNNETFWLASEPINLVADASYWSFNNYTNIIPTIITQNTDGSITMNCIDHQGTPQSNTFVD